MMQNKRDLLKVPPHDLDAEQSVLGALMIDKYAIVKVVDILQPEDFYKPAHGHIYDAAISLYKKSQPIDIVSVSARLKEKQLFEDVGGNGYLSDLLNRVPSASHAEHYATIVKEKHILRDLISASLEIAENAFGSREANDEGGLDSLLDTVEQKIFNITQRSVTQQFVSIQDELENAYARIEELHKSDGTQLRGISTGFERIDSILSGLQKSDLILLGARPSLGKTSLALDIARHVAVNEGKAVGFYSLEMSREQIVDRIIAAQANVSLWELRSGNLRHDTDFAAIQEALDKLSKAPIYIDDTPSPDILQMRAMARRLQMEHGLSLIVIDYLQLIRPRSGRDNMVQQVTEISRGLKSLARELKVPVLALSQLSRNVDQRDDKRPKLHDLRESGSLEQDSDVVMFIYRKDRHQENLPPEEQNIAEVLIAKHRNGALGNVKLKFTPEYASFRNLEERYNEENYI